MEKNIKKYRAYKFCAFIFVIAIIIGILLLHSINNREVIPSYLSKNSDEILEFLNKIDKTLLSVVSINDKNEIEEFSLEEKLDFANAYIIQNFKSYKKEIKYLEKDFCFYTNDTQIYSVGYVDKELIKQIIFEIFGRCDIIFKGYKFYDEENDLVALVPFFMENTGYEKVDMVKLNPKEKNIYTLTLKYTRSFENITNSFFVDYIIKKEGENNYLTSMKIYNSKLY